MTTASAHKYKPGDRVSVPIEADLRWPGLVVNDRTDPFCPTCHCDPADPIDHYDGTLCCPGPWYVVDVLSPDANGIKSTIWTFAEHELTQETR
jgi:hypothetical protein